MVQCNAENDGEMPETTDDILLSSQNLTEAVRSINTTLRSGPEHALAQVTETMYMDEGEEEKIMRLIQNLSIYHGGPQQSEPELSISPTANDATYNMMDRSEDIDEQLLVGVVQDHISNTQPTASWMIQGDSQSDGRNHIIHATQAPVSNHPPAHINVEGIVDNDHCHKGQSKSFIAHRNLKEGGSDDDFDEQEFMEKLLKTGILDDNAVDVKIARSILLEKGGSSKDIKRKRGRPRKIHRRNKLSHIATPQGHSFCPPLERDGSKEIIHTTLDVVSTHPPAQLDVDRIIDNVEVHSRTKAQSTLKTCGHLQDACGHLQDEGSDNDVNEQELMERLLKSGILNHGAIQTKASRPPLYMADDIADAEGVSRQLIPILVNDGCDSIEERWGMPRKNFVTSRLHNNKDLKYTIRATLSPVPKPLPTKVNIANSGEIIERAGPTNSGIPHTYNYRSDTNARHLGQRNLSTSRSIPRRRGRPPKPKRSTQGKVKEECADSFRDIDDTLNMDEFNAQGEQQEAQVMVTECSSHGSDTEFIPLGRLYEVELDSQEQDKRSDSEDLHDDEYRVTPPPQPVCQPQSPEATSPAPIGQSIQDIATQAMARPLLWIDGFLNWKTLGVNQWLEATVANFYLLHVWYGGLGRSPMRYVDMYAAIATDMDDDELKAFQKYHFVSHDGCCPMVPVGFIVHHSQHFFVVIFDYHGRTAHILGRRISDDFVDVDGHNSDDWNNWRGPEYWIKIAALHGWSTGDINNICIRTRDWAQNGVDCGPIACAVLEQVLNSGLDQDGNLPFFQVQCGHQLRIKMLHAVAGRIRMGCSDFMMLLDRPQDGWSADELPDNDVISSIQNGQLQNECLSLLRTLAIIGATCTACKRPSLIQDIRVASQNVGYSNEGTVENDTGEDEYADQDDVLGMALSADRKATLIELFKVHKDLAGARDRTMIIPRAIGTHIPLEPQQTQDVSGPEDSQRSCAAVATRRRVVNWQLGSSKRFPRPTAPVPLAAYTGSRWLMHNRKFDDYDGGPTIEMRRPSDAEPTLTYPEFGGVQLSTGWASWVDHGFRIGPSSFHNFYQCEPIAIMDHIMAVGTCDSYGASHQVPDHVSGAYSLHRLQQAKDNALVQVADVEIMSGADMIDMAQYDPPLDEACTFGHNAFIRGRTNQGYGDGTPIYLDLEQDAIQFSADEIKISVDIDSIIWTTKIFRCQGTVGIYLTPPFHVKPGIFKHNHTYVDIIIPQSEEDANTPGGRTEWLSKRLPMSTIPHVCIGRISSASSILNLYIMFPRMIHQHPINGRRITLIPQEVLDIFWDRVLLPSIGDCTDVSWAPYLKQSLNEARFKSRSMAGRSGGRGAPKAIPLSDDDFRDVQERMNNLIYAGHGELSMYGSSFFVLEGKGIKLLTKDGQRGRFTGAEEALVGNFPDLDWAYMMNRTHGELLVDVGISFTPHSSDIPIIGLWRLDALEASFGAGGYKRGEMHHHNTLSRYGALQAEMQQERAQQTHIAFRSTYNLYYEAIRTNSNQGNFTSDSDAYKLSPSYMSECFSITKVLEGCKDRTYGVRDEYRMSGQAARVVLDGIHSKAEEYLHSDPILWIPADVWFNLLRRRVREIQRTQIAIKKKNPPNLGILTGVLNHMLLSTTSTPVIYDHHTRESLALLQFRNVQETAGMFFLQEFDISSDTCLDEVQQADDVSVMALMGASAKAQRDRAVGSMKALEGAESESDDYPLGRAPTWNHLKATISHSPTIIMRPWIFPSSLFNVDLSVARLFTMLTRQIWLMLAEEVLKGIRPYPNSLQEAMRCWTITSIDDTLAAVAFDACNAGLHDNSGVTPGRMGPRSRSFASRCSVFFPNPEASHKDHSQWSVLWKGDGYIAQFHRMMEKMDNNQQLSLKEGLSEVFQNLHCLPGSGGRVWTQRNGAVVFITNPTFYRISCLGRGADKMTKTPKTRRTMKLIKGKRTFAADLMDSTPFDVDGNLKRKTDRQKRRELHKKMTMANRNKRIPPPPRPRKCRPFPMSTGESMDHMS